MSASRRVVAMLVLAAAAAGTAACGLVIGLSDHDAYPAEGGTTDAARETSSPDGPVAESGGNDAPANDANDGGPDVSDAGGCDGSTCNGVCVDTQSDNANCGGCGNVCDGSACYHGTCDGKSVAEVTAGTSHACALLKSGDVWCWGADDQAQILGPSGAASCPSGPCRVATHIDGLPNAVQISAGGNQTCAVESKGGVWCWGSNATGGLGHAPSGDSTCTTADGGLPCNATPTKVAGLGAATEVATGQVGFACALVGSNVYCWGDDSHAELGPSGDGGASSSPVIVVGGATSIAAGYEHVCAVVAGNPTCWGSNTSGELGHAPGVGDQSCGGSPCLGTPQSISVSGTTGVHAGFHASCFTTSGVPSCLGANDVAQLGGGAADVLPHPTPAPVTVQTSTTALDLTSRTVCAVSGGAVHCWGDDQTHQTSAPTPGTCAGGPCQAGSIAVTLTGTPVAVTTSPYASFARTADGTIWAWGANGSGQLGHAPNSGGDTGSCDPATFPGGTVCNGTPSTVQGLP